MKRSAFSRFFSFFLAMVMVLSMVQLPVFAEENEDEHVHEETAVVAVVEETAEAEAPAEEVPAEEAPVAEAPAAAPLAVTRQPADAFCAVGETAGFSVAAEGGIGELSYVWMSSADGSEWKTEGFGAVLTVVGSEETFGHSFRCQITDSEGNTVVSAAAVLSEKIVVSDEGAEDAAQAPVYSAEDHVHDYSSVDRVYDDEHGLSCTICGRSTWGEHEFENNVCTVCGYTKHEHNFVFDPTQRYYPLLHFVSCTICGQTELEGHGFDETGTCICGIKDHEHNWVKGPEVSLNWDFHVAVCADCGASGEIRHTVENGVCTFCGWDFHTHNFVYVGGKRTEKEHDTVCTICDGHYAWPHFMRDGVCTECGYGGHEHSIPVVEGKNPNVHYGTCSTCNQYIFEPHTFENDTCTVCGYYVHEHSFGSVRGWSDNEHYFECAYCDETKWEEHDPKDGVCSTCGFFKHEHEYGDVTWRDDEGHSRSCQICNRYFWNEHTFDNNGTCTVCGFFRHEHDFQFASDYLPYEDGHDVICTICGNNRRVEHQFKNGVCICGCVDHRHTYTFGNRYGFWEDNHTIYCTDCGVLKSERHSFDKNNVCTVCGYFPHEEDYKYQGGYRGTDYHDVICAVCGSWSSEPHTFNQNGICTVCGYEKHEHVLVYMHNKNYDDRGHYDICEICGITEFAPHDLKNNANACAVCEYNKHTHDFRFDDGNTYTAEGHSTYCSICGRYNQERHTIKDSACTVCGFRKHTHEMKVVEGYPNDYSHTLQCKVCGMVDYSQQHSYDKNGVCTVCSYKNHVHKFTVLHKAYVDDYFHYHDCEICGMAQNSVHTWNASHTACTTCGYYVHEHKYETVQADEYSHLVRCKICEGEEYQNHTFNDAMTCTVCGYSDGVLSIAAPSGVLFAGKNMTLTATMDGKAAKVTWKLEGTGAKLDAKGKLTADKNLTEPSVVTVTATTAEGQSDSVRVTLCPAAKSVIIQAGGYFDASGKTLNFGDYGNGMATLEFTGFPDPDYAAVGVTWSVSGEKGAYEITQNNESYLTLANLKVPAGKTSMKLTVTATANDGSGKKSSVTVVMMRSTIDFQIVAPGTLTAGKSATLTTSIASQKEYAPNKFSWILDNPEDEAYVTLTSAGKLTAKKVSEPHTVRVIAVNLTGDSKVTDITIVPLPASAAITSSRAAGADGIINIKGIPGGYEALKLSASVAPASASQAGTWKVSGPAKIDANGNVTFTKDGVATFTFTANDAKVSASVKVRAGYPVETITLNCPDETIQSGKKVTIKAELNKGSTAPYVKTLEWISSDPSVAEVKAGAVTAKNVYEPTQVTITAVAADGSGVTASKTFVVLPKAGSLAIRKDGAIVNDTTINVNVNGEHSVQLTGPEGTVWSTSNKAAAIVSEDGLVVVLKAGSVVKITAKNGKDSGTVSIKGVVPVAGITLSTKDNPIITIGKSSFTAKANITNQDATDKSVIWTTDRPDLVTINASGKLTVNKGVTGSHMVMVTATAADGFGATASARVTLVPAATAVRIRNDQMGALNDRTITISLKDGPVVLNANVEPLSTNGSANQTVEWKSSSSKVAAASTTVPADGMPYCTITPMKPGKTTISATTTDGTKITAKFTLVVTE